MSDTLQEEEDRCTRCGATSTEIHRLHYLGGSPSECRHEWPIRKQKDQNAAVTADYCDKCKGRPHAPWCSEYKGECFHFYPNRSPSASTPNFDNCIHCGKKHEPAARGGGEEWRVAQRYDGVVLIVRAESDNRETPLLTLSKSDDDYVMANRIVTEHNQHQALVAERERLRQQNERLVKALRSTAHNAADGSGLCWCAVDDRVFGHRTKCMSLRRVINQQRSTSE